MGYVSTWTSCKRVNDQLPEPTIDKMRQERSTRVRQLECKPSSRGCWWYLVQARFCPKIRVRKWSRKIHHNIPKVQCTWWCESVRLISYRINTRLTIIYKHFDQSTFRSLWPKRIDFANGQTEDQEVKSRDRGPYYAHACASAINTVHISHHGKGLLTIPARGDNNGG